MSPRNKATTESSGPRWCIVNPQLFSLSPEENQLVNHHRAIWHEHCQGAKPSAGLDLELEWQGFENDARHGCEKALENIARFGCLENFARYRRIEQESRNNRFHREHCTLFEMVKPIAARARERFQELLKTYRAAGAEVRALLEASPAVRDETTNKLEALIAACSAIENRTPTGFEVLNDHIEITEIFDGEEVEE